IDVGATRHRGIGNLFEFWCQCLLFCNLRGYCLSNFYRSGSGSFSSSFSGRLPNFTLLNLLCSWSCTHCHRSRRGSIERTLRVKFTGKLLPMEFRFFSPCACCSLLRRYFSLLQFICAGCLSSKQHGIEGV